MLYKVTHCTGLISASYTRLYQLHWGDREMGTAILCTECSQVAGLIQMVVYRDSTKAPSLRAAVLHAAVFRSKIVHVFIRWQSFSIANQPTTFIPHSYISLMSLSRNPS